MTKLNITDMETLPEEISAKMTSIEVNSDLWAVEDKILKTSLSVKSLLLAAGNLNVSATPDIDADGKPVFPPRDSGPSYHTPQSWRDKGQERMDTHRLQAKDYITTRGSGKRRVRSPKFRDD